MRLLALLAAFALVACGEHDHEHDHAAHDDHNHAPKYDGQLVELGDHEFQVELLLEPESGKLVAYLWDGHVERAVPATMKSLTVHATVGDEKVTLELTPVANPYGDEAGKSSEYAGQSDKLKKIDHFDGELAAIEIAGKRFEAVAFRYHAR